VQDPAGGVHKRGVGEAQATGCFGQASNRPFLLPKHFDAATAAPRRGRQNASANNLGGEIMENTAVFELRSALLLQVVFSLPPFEFHSIFRRKRKEAQGTLVILT